MSFPRLKQSKLAHSSLPSSVYHPLPTLPSPKFRNLVINCQYRGGLSFVAEASYNCQPWKGVVRSF